MMYSPGETLKRRSQTIQTHPVFHGLEESSDWRRCLRVMPPRWLLLRMTRLPDSTQTGTTASTAAYQLCWEAVIVG